MNYINTFENFKGFIAGTTLLASLLAHPLMAQDNRHTKREKAKMSVMYTTKLDELTNSIRVKKYELYSNNPIRSNNILFTTGTGIKFKDALEKAQEDADNKLEFLGKKGAQQIWRSEVAGTFSVIIITEILSNEDTVTSGN